MKSIDHKTLLVDILKKDTYFAETVWSLIDESLYKPINQALIVPNYGKDSKLANDFKAYILSDKAKEKFLKFGYSVE